MGLKYSKEGKNKKKEEINEGTDDESETLEIMQGEEWSEEGNEEMQEGFSEWFGKCGKSSSLHAKFIFMKKLHLEQLPESIRYESVLRYIQLRAQLVVRVTVKCTSTARSENKKEEIFASLRGKTNCRLATGYAWISSDEPSVTKCPKKSCKVNDNQHSVYRGILITTNRHVIFNNEEAKQTEVEFFYDDKDSESSVVNGIGYCLREDLEQKDYVSLKIYCHDESLFHKICKINEEIMKTWERISSDCKTELEKHAIVISHPHGKYKKVSIGELLDKEVHERESGRKVTKYTCTTCSGSSGAPVLTGVYWTNPFVHSSGRHNKKTDVYTGVSYSY